LNDPEYSENDLQTQNGSDEEAHSESDDSDVVIIDDEKENDKGKKVKGGVVMAKAYRVEPPLANPRKPRNSGAGEVLDKMTNAFDPAAIRQRDEH
jgi:hypothetical protein